MYNYHSSSSRPPADLMDGTFEESQPLHITAHHDKSQNMETELEKHIRCPCAQCQKRPFNIKHAKRRQWRRSHRFKCTNCLRYFIGDKHTCTEHMKTHTNKCTECEDNFSSPSALKK